MYTMGYYSALKKERHPVICSAVNERGRQYTKRNKPDTERKKLHNLIYMGNLKVKYIERERKMMVSRVRS